jgi:hypothetical protein
MCVLELHASASEKGYTQANRAISSARLWEQLKQGFAASTLA